MDESLTIWKIHLSLKEVIPLKDAEFGTKSYELCKSRTGYVLSFTIYTG
jgi:hypothetical protein